MKKIKVLHISETFVTGVYTYIQSICAFTAQNPNIETHIIFSPNREGTNNLDFGNDFSGEVQFYPISMVRQVSPLKDHQSLQKLKKTIKQIQPDVIHLHSSKAGVLGRIAAKAYPKAKLFYTPHGYAFLRNDISSLKKIFFKSIEKLIAFTFKSTTLACGDNEHEIAKSFGDSILIRNGVLSSDFSPSHLNKNVQLKSIVTVGRISYQKKPKLFNTIALKFPSLKFIWIGDGELKHELNAKNIEVTGWLERGDVLKKVASQDIYIQTSLWEGLPFTIIEAMVMYKPILATNVVGNKDTVEHQKNGFLCNDVNDFKKAIDLLQKDADLRLKFGLRSFEIAKKKFDRNKNFKKLVEIYTS